MKRFLLIVALLVFFVYPVSAESCTANDDCEFKCEGEVCVDGFSCSGNYCKIYEGGTLSFKDDNGDIIDLKVMAVPNEHRAFVLFSDLTVPVPLNDVVNTHYYMNTYELKVHDVYYSIIEKESYVYLELTAMEVPAEITEELGQEEEQEEYSIPEDPLPPPVPGPEPTPPPEPTPQPTEKPDLNTECENHWDCVLVHEDIVDFEQECAYSNFVSCLNIDYSQDYWVAVSDYSSGSLRDWLYENGKKLQLPCPVFDCGDIKAINIDVRPVCVKGKCMKDPPALDEGYKCVDTDGGIDFHTKGALKIVAEDDGTVVYESEDYCRSGNAIVDFAGIIGEFYCEGNDYKIKFNGCECAEGKCKGEPVEQAEFIDEGGLSDRERYKGSEFRAFRVDGNDLIFESFYPYEELYLDGKKIEFDSYTWPGSTHTKYWVSCTEGNYIEGYDNYPRKDNYYTKTRLPSPIGCAAHEKTSTDVSDCDYKPGATKEDLEEIWVRKVWFDGFRCHSMQGNSRYPDDYFPFGSIEECNAKCVDKTAGPEAEWKYCAGCWYENGCVSEGAIRKESYCNKNRGMESLRDFGATCEDFGHNQCKSDYCSKESVCEESGFIHRLFRTIIRLFRAS